MTPEAAAALLREYHFASPRPTETGEDAKLSCLSNALAGLSQRRLAEAYELRWGAAMKAAKESELLAVIIARAKRERLARLRAEGVDYGNAPRKRARPRGVPADAGGGA